MEREISFSTKFKRPLNKSAKGQTCSDETLMYDNNYTNNTSNTKSKLFKKVKSEKIGKIKKQSNDQPIVIQRKRSISLNRGEKKLSASRTHPQFGIPFNLLEKLYRGKLPPVLIQSSSIILNHLNTEGLFRIPGKFSYILQLKYKLESGGNLFNNKKEPIDINKAIVSMIVKSQEDNEIKRLSSSCDSADSNNNNNNDINININIISNIPSKNNEEKLDNEKDFAKQIEEKLKELQEKKNEKEENNNNNIIDNENENNNNEDNNNDEEDNEEIKIDDPNYIDVHSIAGLLSLFCRELPEPLLTYALYDYWMHCIVTEFTNDEERFEQIVNVTKLLPDYNYKLFKFLIELLSNIAKFSSSNRMNARNLSLIFGASLLNPPPSSPYLLQQQILLIEIFITNYSFIFEGIGSPVPLPKQKDLPTIPAGLNYLNIEQQYQAKKRCKESQQKKLLEKNSRSSKSLQNFVKEKEEKEKDKEEKEEKKSIKRKIFSFSSKIKITDSDSDKFSFDSFGLLDQSFNGNN